MTCYCVKRWNADHAAAARFDEEVEGYFFFKRKPFPRILKRVKRKDNVSNNRWPIVRYYQMLMQSIQTT